MDTVVVGNVSLSPAFTGLTSVISTRLIRSSIGGVICAYYCARLYSIQPAVVPIDINQFPQHGIGHRDLWWRRLGPCRRLLTAHCNAEQRGQANHRQSYMKIHNVTLLPAGLRPARWQGRRP